MSRNWMMVIAASLFEVGWVIGLKHAAGLFEWALTVICIAVSFSLMIAAARTLPVGTVYAVFVGLGTAGTVIADIVLFDAPLQAAKIALIALLLLGVVGLKLVSGDKQKEVS